MLIGSIYGLKKFSDWSEPISTGVVYLGNYTKPQMLYKFRNKMTILQLGFVWIFTMISLAFNRLFDIWGDITAPILISVSAFITICCILSMIFRRYCNVFHGVCSLYFGYICLLPAYQFGYFQFSMSFWWLVMAIALKTIASIVILWLFIKNERKISKPSKKQTSSLSALGIALMVYPFMILARRYAQTNYINHDFGVSFVMFVFLFFALLPTGDVRYLVLDDSKILKEYAFVDGAER